MLDRGRRSKGIQAAGGIEAAYENSPFGMSVTSARPENLGAYLAANPAYCALTGYTLAELREMTFESTCHPTHRAAANESARELLSGASAAVDATTRLMRADGSALWVREHRSLVRDDAGEPLSFLTHTENIADRNGTDAALIEAKGRFRSAFDNAPIGISLANADRRNGDRYIEVNRAFCEMTGYSSEQLLERSFLDITHPDDRTVNSDLWTSLLAGDIQTYQLEKRYVRADGETIWVLVNTSISYDFNDRPLHKITQIVDISERKNYEVQLQHLAHYDSLTGLLNRRHFESALEKQIQLARSNGTQTAVALIDLDNFKYVNDTLGHVAGDSLLCRIATVLTAQCRDDDVVARLGGDEFAVIMRDVGAAQANRIANDIRTAICEDTMIAAMRSIHVSASIGVAFVDSGQYATAQDVLVAADVAMYDAKKAGRNRVSLTLSVTEPRANMQARFTWVERVRDALLRDRFVLFAQPVLNCATDTVDRYELLLRMVGEDGDLVLPTDFLPTAERFGLIGEIDKWVVRRAIAALRDASALGRSACFSVNISATSITSSDVSAFIEAELSLEPRIGPESLIFELKGTSAIANIDNARELTERLRRLGCAFSLDDFGAGLNSFAYLKHLAFDTVKIDSSFIAAIGESASDRLMVEAMVQIVTSLGKQTVAECVENERTLTIVREAGVDFAQGNYIGCPLPLTEIHVDTGGSPSKSGALSNPNSSAHDTK